MGQLDGKRALVTGGGRGIGAAIARALAAAGAQVVVAGRTLGDLDAIARELGGHALTVDLGDRADTDRMLGEIAALGRVDILVNNAGAAVSEPLDRTDDAMWDRVMELDAAAPFRITRALAPAMIAAGWGRIVNIASNAGVSGYGYTAAYCAAKHAMVGWTRALAIDLARAPASRSTRCARAGSKTRISVDDSVARVAARTGRSEQDAARAGLAAMSPQKPHDPTRRGQRTQRSCCAPTTRAEFTARRSSSTEARS